ncbi:MAG: cytochrome-c oxidase [Deltaproteobacteria bacterium]|nr:cytochrome-c oxidase [Deltaproteobacteria bacterium]
MANRHSHNAASETRTYVAVWLVLMGLLAATVAVARLNLLVQFSVLGSLGIASVKAGLVLLFFMHLKDEGLFLKIMLAMALFALTVLIGLLYADIWMR